MTRYYAKYSPPAYKGRPSHGFTAYLPTRLTILMLRSAQAEHQYSAKYKNAR